MKKGIIIFILLVVFGIIFYKWFFNQPCLPPEKPASVPEAAVWKGDCDGGSWIELVSLEKEKIRFKIYRDWNGELLLDADFKYADCGTFRLTKSNWVKHIAYFGNALEIYESSNAGSRCRLEPIYPVYYEENIE